MKLKRRGTAQNRKITGKTAVILAYAIAYVICVFTPFLSSIPENYSFKVGEISEQTLTAPYDIEDKVATQLLKDEAVQKVEPVYKKNDTITQEVRESASNAFEKADTVRKEALKIYCSNEGLSKISSSTLSEISWATYLSSQELNKLKSLAPSYFTNEEIYAVASLTEDKLSTLKEAAMEHLNMALDSGINSDYIETAISKIRSEMISTGSFNSKMIQLTETIFKNTVQANVSYDSEATEQKKIEAEKSISPVVYKRGQNIVQKGEIITESHMRIITELGLATDNSTFGLRLLESFIIITLIFAAAALYSIKVERKFIENTRIALCMALLIVLSVVLSLIARIIDLRIIPAYLSIIISIAILPKNMSFIYMLFISAITAICQCPSVEYIFSSQILITMLATVLGGTFAIMLFRKNGNRMSYILSGLIAGVIATIVYIIYGMFEAVSTRQMLNLMILALGSGVACGIVSLGALPLIEMLFSFATPTRLLELASPNMPLLKKLMTDAPGTYHHVVMAANLAEAGCDAVGADGLLARVATYYHDIGKLRSPKMFTENQMNMQNPHDEFTPEESAAIIIGHVKDGVKMAERNKLPKEIIDIIAQHHGNSITPFFYYKAKQQNENVNEADFRYPGPKPQTKEAAIVMLSDVVEAAVRSKRDCSEEELEEFINKLVHSKYEDGQLDESPLTLKDIDKIIKAFKNEFSGIYHERIEYPELEEI